MELANKIILWDFDGVLMDSNAVRELGFKTVLAEFPTEKVDQLIEFHRINGGLSRYVKFRYFYEEICNLEIDDEKINLLANAFSKIMKELLINEKLLITDSMNFVKKMHHQGVKMHIVSGSDHKELNYLCEELQINHFFMSINGSPTKKNKLVKDLLSNFNYENKNVVLIGDSINDYDAAKENNIDFWGYNNLELIELSTYIHSFKDDSYTLHH